MKRTQSRRYPGFTIIELLVTIALITVLVGLLLPAVQGARETARRMTCQSSMRQIGIAIQNFHSRFNHVPRVPRNMLLHWHYQILNDLEQSGLHRITEAEISNRVPWTGMTGVTTRVPIFECPSDPNNSEEFKSHLISGHRFASTNYIGLTGQSLSMNDGVFPSPYGSIGGLPIDEAPRIRFRDVMDGLSNTFMLTERPIADKPVVGAWLSSQEYGSQSIGSMERANPWLTPPALNQCHGVIAYGLGDRKTLCDQLHPWSHHANGASFVLADASVHFIPYAIEPEILGALSTIAGHENALLND